jgi:hypothetical protein
VAWLSVYFAQPCAAAHEAVPTSSLTIEYQSTPLTTREQHPAE